MEIKTKYSIGDRIWIVYLHNKEICLYDDTITSIMLDDEGICYFGKYAGDEITEENIVKYEDRESLIKKILELTQKEEYRMEEK